MTSVEAEDPGSEKTENGLQGRVEGRPLERGMRAEVRGRKGCLWAGGRRKRSTPPGGTGCFSVSAREPGASQQDGEMRSLTLC